MYWIRLLCWIRSYVKFSVRAGSLERLLNLCTHHKIPIWNCRREGHDATGCTTIAGYHRLRSIVRKNGIRLKVIERRGARFIGYQYRKRIGIVLGIVLFLSVLIVSQQFVWNVRIEGCENAQEEQMLYQLLEMQGVERGAMKKKLDLYRVARTVELEGRGISWAALNLRGTTAILKINERTLPPTKIDLKAPANVVAAQDGQIITLQVTDGKAVLKAGDTVRAGELIVSGVREDRWGVTHLIRANANVIAHLPASLSVEVPLVQEEIISAGRVVQRKYFELFELRLPLFLYTGMEGIYKLEQYTTPLRIGENIMPLAYTKERYIFYQTRKKTIQQEEALQLAQKELLRLEQKKFSQSKILFKEVSAVCENGVLTLSGIYELEQNIAKQVEIELLERSKPQKPTREGGY